MKILLQTILIILAVTTASAEQALEITHLTGDVYVYTTYHDYNHQPFPSNGMYIVTNEGVVMIDTPWDTTQFQPLLDSIYARHRQRVVLCIATHFHDDRSAGLDYYKQKGVRTFTSKQTYELCAAEGNARAEFTFTRDTTFTVGNHTFRAYYPGAGHTKDNIVVWMNNEKILYGGCLVKSVDNDGLGNIADANLKAWAPTIKNVIRTFPNPKFIIPGHFSWTDTGALKHTLMLLQKHGKMNKKSRK